MRLLLLLPLLCLPACASVQERKCTALQSVLQDANDPCTECTQTLAPVQLAALCAYACGHQPTISSAVTKECAPEAPATTPPQTAEVTQ